MSKRPGDCIPWSDSLQLHSYKLAISLGPTAGSLEMRYLLTHVQSHLILECNAGTLTKSALLLIISSISKSLNSVGQ